MGDGPFLGGGGRQRATDDEDVVALGAGRERCGQRLERTRHALVGEVAVRVTRCGDQDEAEVALFHRQPVLGRRSQARADRGEGLLETRFLDRRPTLVDGCDHARIDVDADHVEAPGGSRSREAHSQLAQAYDRYSPHDPPSRMVGRRRMEMDSSSDTISAASGSGSDRDAVARVPATCQSPSGAVRPVWVPQTGPGARSPTVRAWEENGERRAGRRSRRCEQAAVRRLPDCNVRTTRTAERGHRGLPAAGLFRAQDAPCAERHANHALPLRSSGGRGHQCRAPFCDARRQIQPARRRGRGGHHRQLAR